MRDHSPRRDVPSPKGQTKGCKLPALPKSSRVSRAALPASNEWELSVKAISWRTQPGERTQHESVSASRR